MSYSKFILNTYSKLLTLYNGSVELKSKVLCLISLSIKESWKVPEKIKVSQEDLAELKNPVSEQPAPELPSEETQNEQEQDVSIEDLKEEEASTSEQEDTDPTNNQ